MKELKPLQKSKACSAPTPSSARACRVRSHPGRHGGRRRPRGNHHVLPSGGGTSPPPSRPRRSRRARGARNLTRLAPVATRAVSPPPPPPQYVYAIPPRRRTPATARTAGTSRSSQGCARQGHREGRPRAHRWRMSRRASSSRRAGCRATRRRARRLSPCWTPRALRAARGGRGDKQARVPGPGVQAAGRRVRLQARRAGAPAAR